MQTIYATHLPLPAPAGESQARARGAVAAWVMRRFNIVIDGDDGRESQDGATVGWSVLRSGEDELLSVWTQLPDQHDPAWTYLTYIDLGLEGDTAWIRVRVNLQSAVEGLLIRHQGEVGRPGVVRDLINDLDLHVDGQPLAQYQALRDYDDGAEFARFILSRSRRLPVVAVTRAPNSGSLVPPGLLRDRLLGLAHVVTLSSDASYALSGVLGPRLSVFGGAVRLYWPGFSSTDDPYRHRLYMPPALERLGDQAVIAELFERLGQLAGFSLDEPQLRRRLLAERRRRNAEADAAMRAEVAARLQPETKGDDGVSSAEYADLFAEFERVDARATALEEEAADRDEELLSAELERDDFREQLDALLEAWREERAGRLAATPGEFEPLEFASVVEAVEAAASRAMNLVILPEAYESARSSGYAYSKRVFDDLMLASSIADAWAAGDLTTGPTNEFKQQCGAFRDGIGQIAETRYRSDYEREYEGETVLLEPHIRRGIGAVSNIMRIYMYFDSVRGRIVVGHVGRKLRDNSNRN